MKKIRKTRAVNRLSIILAIVIPLVFIVVVILKNQTIPVGFEIIEFAGIMLAIAVAVWVSLRLTFLLANILGDWLDDFLSKRNKSSQIDTAENHGYQTKVIDAEIVEEETPEKESLEGGWQTGSESAKAKAIQEWHKATMDPHSALSTQSKSSPQSTRPKRKRIIGPPSRMTKTIMVVIAFVILFCLIVNLLSEGWLTLIAPIPGLWAIITLWRIWDPKNTPSSARSNFGPNAEPNVGQNSYKSQENSH